MGTDLGGTFDDIQNSNLTLGGVVCSPLNTNYIPWRQFVCETTNFVTGGSKDFSLTIGSRVSAGFFTAVDPTINSVSPTIGPMAGGTTVAVKGTGLDVGNKENTRVSLEVDVKQDISISASIYVCNILWVTLLNSWCSNLSLQIYPV